ncbi:MAG: hypothetical protein ACHP7O_01245 [Burkholderiales bacterium]
MKYPNLRYGNPQELQHYAQGMPIAELAKRLRRSEKCIKNWITQKQKTPYWVTELLRLQAMEHREMMRQMGIYKKTSLLGKVTPTGTIYTITTTSQTQKPILKQAKSLNTSYG